jgi:hypothetical protein
LAGADVYIINGFVLSSGKCLVLYLSFENGYMKKYRMRTLKSNEQFGSWMML